MINTIFHYSLALLVYLSATGCGRTVTKGTPTEEVQVQNGMEYVLHKANTRGKTNAGWLQATHTFSFNRYYDPDRMNFGALRVLNDDIIGPGGKFPNHPHENMEIITVPLQGAMTHSDNMGHSGVITTGDIQIMSAGTGIVHSEANESQTDTLLSLQIWVLPNKRNVTPRYDQRNNVWTNQEMNTMRKLIGPNDPDVMFIHQDAVFTMGKFQKGKKSKYSIAFNDNGVYAFIIEGSAKINGVQVETRDGMGIWNVQDLDIEATDDLLVLLMDVPMLE